MQDDIRLQKLEKEFDKMIYIRRAAKWIVDSNIFRIVDIVVVLVISI